MANKQIDELSELTTVSGTDLLLVYDLNEAGSEKTKKITVSNLITDYEEGTFTPEVADAASGGNEGSAGAASGKYTKIGNMVSISIDLTNIDTTGLTAGNTFYITGLPFNSLGTYYASVWVQSVNFGGAYLLAKIVSTTDTIIFNEIYSNNVSQPSIVSDFSDDTADIRLSAVYYV